jgi:hypothetical protein
MLVALLGRGKFFFFRLTLDRTFRCMWVCLHGPCTQPFHATIAALEAHYAEKHSPFLGLQQEDLATSPTTAGTQVNNALFDAKTLVDSANRSVQSLTITSPLMPTTPSSRNKLDNHHICSTCDKAFGRKGDLDRHARTHTQAARYYCPIYGCRFSARGFHRRDKLLDHMRQGHKNTALVNDSWVDTGYGS